ncbi:glycosyltransferase [Paracoccus sp. Z330]|uniref:Glycosyltransferase n=1 Tax=Paracoccus onchidii TaxID=3017813 RepID=A0ABT4ZFD7_9RHOB|nr:glycosyltransferase [Paracoccus onchidii]MDB6178094.1 glycosyltransferase [Paracoccus onchidii]
MIFLYRAKTSQRGNAVDRLPPPLVVVLDPIATKDQAGWKAVVEAIATKADRPVYGLSSHALDGVEADLGFEPADIDLWMAFDLIIPSENDHAALPTELLGFLLTLRMRSVRTLYPDGHLVPYSRPSVPGARRVLFLFPGMFCPPEMGSHQRACSTVMALLNAGFEVDIVLRASGSQDFRSKERYLRLLSNRTEWFSTPRALKTEERKAYETQCKAEGIRPRFPLTLQERMGPLSSPAAKELVERLLATQSYDSVLASYIWWSDLLRSIDLDGARLIYDTHDVHTMRLAQHSDAVAESIFDMEAEREKEISVLREADHVLAISQRDKDIFEEDYGLTNVVNIPVPYIGGARPGRLPRSMQSLTFGFLGSGMDANIRALEFILSEWWPSIHHHTPESKFLIAGAISDNPTVQDIVFLRDEVTSLGRVEFIGSFYDQIDVLLSPVIIPGGLNIKMVEALLSSCIVITNTLGAQPLLPLEIATKADTADEVIGLIEGIESGSEHLRTSIDANFREANRLFQTQDDAVLVVRSIFAHDVEYAL